MKVTIGKNYNELSRLTADFIADYVRQKPGALLCLPSGESPTGTLAFLVKYAREGKIDFSNCYFTALDEWVGIGGVEGSTKKYLNTHFFDLLKIRSDRMIFFNSLADDLDQECRRVDDFIVKHGPIDIMLAGIGMNGHIGLNEPGINFNLYSHRILLHPTTVASAQRYFKDNVILKEGITLGLRHFMESKVPVLIASGTKKADIISKALKRPVSNDIPATIIQNHPNSFVFLDEEAASQLSEYA